MKKTIFTIWVFILISAPVLKSQTFRNVPFSNTPQRTLFLDIYLPEARSYPPVVILVRGGAWNKTDKEFLRPLAEIFVQYGFSAVCIEYRKRSEAIFPAAVDDVAAAVDWIAEHGREFGVSKKKIAIYGVSAGAHLAALVGTNQFSASCVTAVIANSGVYDFTVADRYESEKEKHIEKFLGGSFEEIPEIWKRASPAFNLEAHSAPMLLIHNVADPTAPVAQAHRMLRALLREKVSGIAQVHTWKAHGTYTALWIEYGIKFLRKQFSK